MLSLIDKRAMSTVNEKRGIIHYFSFLAVMRTAQVLFWLAALLLLSSCSQAPSPIKIGFSGQLSGIAGTPSTVVRNGVVLAVEHINAVGGVEGRPVELLIEDDHGEARGAAEIDARHYEAGVEAIIGHTISSMSAAALDFINKKELLMLSPTSSAEYLMGRDDFFFTLYPSNSRLAQKAARFAFEKLKLRRITVAVDFSNEVYTENYYQEFRFAFQQLGGEVLGKYEYFSTDKNDFTTMTTNLIEAEPDGLLVVAASLDTALIAQQLYKRNLEIPIIGSDWAAYQELIEQGGPYVEHIFIASIYSSQQLENSYGLFREEYQRRFREKPSIGGALGYESMWVLAQALELQARRQTLKEVLLGNSFEGFEESHSFNEYGEVQREIFIKTVRNGEFVNANGLLGGLSY